MDIKTDINKFKEEEETRERNKSYTDFFAPKTGENAIRLLPRSADIFTKGDHRFAHEYMVHYNMFDTKGFRMLVCPKTSGDDCPICDYLASIDDKKIRDSLKVNTRFLYSLVDLVDNKVKVYETGPGVYNSFKKYWLDGDWGPAKMIDLEKGCVIKLAFTPADKSDTGWNQYALIMSPREISVMAILGEDWEAELGKLITHVPAVRPIDELKRLVKCFIDGVAPNADFTQAREEIDGVRKEEVTTVVPAAAPVDAQSDGAPLLNKPAVGAGVKPTVAVQPTVSETRIDGGADTATEAANPPCFGNEYRPREEKCKKCSVWIKCRQAVMNAV